jgi:hypothetical protein
LNKVMCLDCFQTHQAQSFWLICFL